MLTLKKIPGYSSPTVPVVLAIMDGVGIGGGDIGDMVSAAHTPHLDWLKANAPNTRLKAHGTAVGMPSDADMGNSEVGHNAIGAGRVFDQGASLVKNAIDTGELFLGATWGELVNPVVQNDATLHFLTLLSDGNVHSHIDHLFAMLRNARAAGVRRARCHILLDGRDVGPTSALDYVERLEAVLAELSTDGADFAVASGGGRLFITMDRYEADWQIVARGWKVHVHGQGRGFATAREAIETFRAEKPGIIDQDLPAFVITRGGGPLGPMRDGDSVILCNFRGDRAIEISRAFDDEVFDKFDRGARPRVRFAGMMQYDGDLKIPRAFLVKPPALSRTMGEYLANLGLRQLAVSETQKYGHVTYFFNGNRSGKFADALEDYVEIKSDRVPFEERPWMKAAEITDVVLDSIRENRHAFVRVNFPNGDMVGHTGVLQAVKISVEATDLCIGRLMEAARINGAVLVVTADHGNADEMLEVDKKTGKPALDAQGRTKSKTSHTLNPVPCYFYDPRDLCGISIARPTGLGISSLAATCLNLLGYEAPEDYSPSIVSVGTPS